MSGGDGLQLLQARVRKLIHNGLGHLSVRVLGHPFLGLGNGVYEPLGGVGIIFQPAEIGKVGGVGNLAALLADGGEHIALAGGLHLSGSGLKEGHIVPLAAGEGPGHHVELHGGIYRYVHSGGQAVLPQDIFQGHLRHAALAAADDSLAPEILPGEGTLCAAHQERAVPFGQLGNDLGVVGLALVIHIDAGLRPRQADVRLAGDHSSHDLVGPAAVGKLHLQALGRKESLAHGHILGRIKHRVGDLVEPHHCGVLLAAGAQPRHDHQCSQQKCQQFFHSPFPQKRFKNFSTHSTSRYITTAAAARITTLVMTRSMLNTWEP